MILERPCIDWVTEPSGDSGTGTSTWPVQQAYAGGPNGGDEVGDRCNTDLFQIPLATGKFRVQTIWSNNKHSCVKGS
jgi:hypothetical protein